MQILIHLGWDGVIWKYASSPSSQVMLILPAVDHTLTKKYIYNSLYISFLNCELLDTRACDLLIFESLESNTHVNMKNILNEFTLCCYLVLIFLKCWTELPETSFCVDINTIAKLHSK